MASPGEALILVVEDDPSIRQLIEWTLEDEGFAVVTASNGLEAIECARDRRPSLVILDMGLPLMDGMRVSANLKSLDGVRAPIIVVSADRQAPEKAQLMGAFDVIRKPFDIEALVKSVENALSSNGARSVGGASSRTASHGSAGDVPRPYVTR